MSAGSYTSGGREREAKVWMIPLAYIAASLTAGWVLPRLEEAFIDEGHPMSVGSAVAFFSAVSSGMMALTGIVFAIAFVVVQFSALAYSPRVAITFAAGRSQYHVLGIFFATFTYSLVALVWTNRSGSGTVPLVSTLVVIALLLASMLAFARMIQNIDDLQIHNVLRFIGRQGREVVDAMFPTASSPDPESLNPAPVLGTPSQTVTYFGEPWTITHFDLAALVTLARGADAVIALECAVGDTLLQDSVVLHVYGGTGPISRDALMETVGLAGRRTFDQDPRYAIRLLVDIAIRALSPGINDPTTAVQALVHIEDLLRRLGQRQLEAGYVRDGDGSVRVVFPVPAWQDYLDLSFREIRRYGEDSIQVMRRLRAALAGLSETITVPERGTALLRYRAEIDQTIGRGDFDELDRLSAMVEDRQGLGFGRPRAAAAPPA
jgi:uncharacterized membrane protein